MSTARDEDGLTEVGDDEVVQWVVVRSGLDPRVWVSYQINGDEASFLNPGGLRAVKRYVETRSREGRWVHVDADRWERVEPW